VKVGGSLYSIICHDRHTMPPYWHFWQWMEC